MNFMTERNTSASTPDRSASKKRKSTPSPFKIGDIVYVLGKYDYGIDEPLYLLECKIIKIEHRQFVSVRTDGGDDREWVFSRRHHNSRVFADKQSAEAALTNLKREQDAYNHNA